MTERTCHPSKLEGLLSELWEEQMEFAVAKVSRQIQELKMSCEKMEGHKLDCFLWAVKRWKVINLIVFYELWKDGRSYTWLFPTSSEKMEGHKLDCFLWAVKRWRVINLIVGKSMCCEKMEGHKLDCFLWAVKRWRIINLIVFYELWKDGRS